MKGQHLSTKKLLIEKKAKLDTEMKDLKKNLMLHKSKTKITKESIKKRDQEVKIHYYFFLIFSWLQLKKKWRDTRN